MGIDPVNGAPDQTKLDPFLDHEIVYMAEETSSLDYNLEKKEIFPSKKVRDIIETEDVCMFMNTNTRHPAAECKDKDNCIFWQVFDVFNKDTAKEYYKKYDGIPVELQGMVNDLF